VLHLYVRMLHVYVCVFKSSGGPRSLHPRLPGAAVALDCSRTVKVVFYREDTSKRDLHTLAKETYFPQGGQPQHRMAHGPFCKRQKMTPPQILNPTCNPKALPKPNVLLLQTN
jgi:hypothetical protein